MHHPPCGHTGVAQRSGGISLSGRHFHFLTHSHNFVQHSATVRAVGPTHRMCKLMINGGKTVRTAFLWFEVLDAEPSHGADTRVSHDVMERCLSVN